MANYKNEKRTARKDRQHYVTNDELYLALIEYRKEIQHAEENNEPKPIVTDYIAECLVKIANKLANMSNFSKYPFRDEMIADAIENCLKYVDRFDPDKSKNPFAYYTQICWYAFIRRIDMEQRYLYDKYSLVRSALLHDIHEEDADFVRVKYGSNHSDDLMNDFMDRYEAKKKKKKKKKEKTSLEQAFEE